MAALVSQRGARALSHATITGRKPIPKQDGVATLCGFFVAWPWDSRTGKPTCAWCAEIEQRKKGSEGR